MKVEELRKMKVEELKKKLSEIKLEIAKEKVKKKTGVATKNPGKLRQLRREVARILTLKREKT